MKLPYYRIDYKTYFNLTPDMIIHTMCTAIDALNSKYPDRGIYSFIEESSQYDYTDINGERQSQKLYTLIIIYSSKQLCKQDIMNILKKIPAWGFGNK